MGNKTSSVPLLKKREVREFMNMTHFDYAEVDALHCHFAELTAEHPQSRLERTVFQKSLGLTDSLFLDRLFRLFDADNVGSITFSEFIKGLSVLCTRGTLKEKIEFSFRMYDFDNDGKISKAELTQMLSTCLKENNITITAEQIASVINETFLECDSNKDGFIDFEEYNTLITQQPSILENMTLDFQRVIERQLEQLKRRRNSVNHIS